MSIATLYIAGIAYTAFSVFGVGFAILAVLRRAGVLRTDAAGSHILCAVALAIYLPTLFLTAIVAFGWGFGATAVNLKLALDALIIAGGAAYGYRELEALGRDLWRGGVLLFVAAGAIAGTWAFLQFPHVLDSGQLGWTQNLLAPLAPAGPSAMLGFSSLIVFLGSIFDTLPLITTAAALKPLLAIIACVAAYHAAESILPRCRIPAALLFIALMALTEFSVRGIASFGKDSVYGVAFSIAFMAVLCRPDAARRRAELGLYFAVAVTTGVIALPYMLVAYVLWLVLARPEERALSTVPALYLIGFLLVPVSVAGFLQIGPLLALAAYSALGLAGFAAARLAAGFAPALLRGSEQLRSVRAWIPLALLLPCMFLMPVDAPITGWRNDDGTLFTQSHAPLDGKTDFFDFLIASRSHFFIVPLGVIAAVSLGFLKLGRERAGLVAVCAMPFAVLLAMLIRANTGLPLLTNFNVWDIVKDTTLWYGGALFALLLVVLLAELAVKVPMPRAETALLLLAGTGLVAATASRIYVGELIGPLTYTRTGAYPSRDMALVSEAAWLQLRGRALHGDMSLAVSRRYFFTLPMYQVRISTLNLDWLAKQKFPPATRIGILAREDQLPAIRALAKEHQASVTELVQLEQDEGLMLVVDFDTKGITKLSRRPGSASVAQGAHDPEVWDGTSFRWLRAAVDVDVVLGREERACVLVDMFSAGMASRAEVVSVEAPGSPPLDIEIAGSTMAQPKRAAIRVAAESGRARLKLTARFPEGSFPKDPRPIAFGLKQPIVVEAAARCDR